MERLKKLYDLRLAFLVFVVLPVAAMVAVSGWLALRALEGWVETRMEREVELIAESVREPLARSLERDRQGTVARTLESAFRLNEVYSVTVYDMEGERLASAGVHDRPDEEEVTDLADREDGTEDYREMAGQRVYSYFVPLDGSAGRPVGLLQLNRRRADVEAEVRRVRRQGATLLLLATAFMVGIVGVGHRRSVGRHVSRLEDTMERVAAGDRSHRARQGGPREIRELSTGLNVMLDSLNRARGRIEEQKNVQVELERRLRHTEKMAVAGQLASGVAHELGSPLSVIDGKAQKWLRRDDLSPELRETLREIRHEVERMVELVTQLLEIGRTEGGQRRSIPAHRLAEAAASQVREQIQGADGRLEVGGPRPAPAVRVAPDRLNRALVNLLRNAAQATPGGEVRLSWSSRNGEVHVDVEDDGPGVDPSLRSRVFEPFFTTRPVGEGTGLGLAMVQSIAEDHDGTVRVDDSPELGGARFRLTLPVADESVEGEGAGAEDAAAGADGAGRAPSPREGSP